MMLVGLLATSYVRAAEPIEWKNPAASLEATAQPVRATLDEPTQAESRVVLQFDSIPTDAERTALEARGVHLFKYLGSNAYFARIDATADSAQGTDGTTDAIPGKDSSVPGAATLEIQPAWKLHPMLTNGNLPDYARFPLSALAPMPEDSSDSSTPRAGKQQSSQDQTLEDQGEMYVLYVLFHEDVDVGATAPLIIEEYGGKVRDIVWSIHMAVVWLPADALPALAQEDAVQWIEPPLPPLQETNSSNRVRTEADTVQAVPYGLDGSGITVLVYDGGYADSSHPDFGGRLTVRDASGDSDHATHVAGTIGGSGAASGGLHRGMAPGVTLESFGFEYDGSGTFLYTNPGDIEADYNLAINSYGAVISNNSIGTNTAANGFPCSLEGNYGATAQLIDAIVAGSLGAPMRIIWANGNERGNGRCGTSYLTTAPPACAKNHITVGALNSNDDSVTSFTSWGPTDDGRLKPDISAPGCQSNGDGGVTSTSSGGSYTVKCGTSMAAPTVTGCTALLLEDYQVQYPGMPLPRNSSLKAWLAHTAFDGGNVGPDYQYGYGSIRIQQAIDFVRGGSFSEESISHNQDQYFFVPVPGGASELKATIAWDDPPGAINTIPELVNDIDIVAISPGGSTTHYPWTLDPADGDSPAVRNQPDRRNNIEQVLVDNPTPGIWTLRISGYSIAQGPQVYSLASSPDLQLCSSSGIAQLSAASYSCESSVPLTVVDCDLNTNPNWAESVQATLSSGSEPAGETVILTETAADSAVFESLMELSESDSAGTLQVAPGDTITLRYIDADDGAGNLNVVRESTAAIDCALPIVTDVSTDNPSAYGISIFFTTDEPTRSVLRYATSCGGAFTEKTNTVPTTNHEFTLTGLESETTYYFWVEVEDEAGNSAADDNGGVCYSFTTLERMVYYTELFSNFDFDLDGQRLEYVPDDSLDQYAVCLDDIGALPVDPMGSIPLSLSDDTWEAVTIGGGHSVWLYGVEYTSFFVNSNGNITFTEGDFDWTESLNDHFETPRISGYFDDLSPNQGGIVMYKEFGDRIAVTWQNVPEYLEENSNTFQVVMHFDGTIQLGWLGIDSQDGLVGISAGPGTTPPDFVEDDLSTQGFCEGPPGKAYGPVPANNATGVSSSLNELSWEPGPRAVEHDVFFSDDPNQLFFRQRQTATTFPLPTLEIGKTYYWRVDEINSSGVAIGDLWQFQVETVAADLDVDGDVDMVDFGIAQRCLTGSLIPGTDPDCLKADLDQDTDLDQHDLQFLIDCISGPNVPPTLGCVSP